MHNTASNEKPILFNTEMVRAILDGRKTVTRRVVKEPYYIDDEEICRVSGLAIHRGTNMTDGMPYPDQPYRPGNILYVRETWGDYSECQLGGVGYYLYRADYPDNAKTYDFDGHICDLPRWHPSIHMPRKAARIFLRVTDVRVERLQDITEEQAKAEGAYSTTTPYIPGKGCTFIQGFGELWNETVKPADRSLYGWDDNPWVWVIEFERVK